ncbi:restriction endonuclease subunit S [Vibrio alginolyticus]|uniref:restriction endonuclease subunit S n=1 Tax=Vibrio alginolyticus TaxID=663 RepID=UPI00215C18B3|nr:restriction endonuclease subunit S [Vibrio alginolyticus]MCR9493241.1 restriction endonuclease subunit S [Vibrio alginolyticus]
MTLTQWKSKSLGYILEKIVGGGTPSKANSQYWDGDIPWASVKDLSSTKLDDTADKISEKGLNNSASNLIPAETIVIPTRMALGKVAITTQAMAINQDLKALFPSKEVCKSYLFQWLIFHAEQIASLGSGSTVKGIRLEQLKKIPFSYPTLKEEQQKIAEILSTVDKKIDLIDQKIAETEKLKTGLMQKLFSEGVGVQDENGNWQPHTEFQYDSWLGKKPKSWQTETLGNILDISSSKRIKREEYVNEGVPFYRSKEIILKSKHLSFTPEIFISRERFDKLSEKFGSPQQGDILISAVGTIGAIYRVSDEEFYFKDGNLLWIRNIDKSRLSSEFLECYLRSYLCQEMLTNLSAGSSQNALTIVKLSKLPLIIPTKDEQKMIVSIISSINEKIYLLKAQRSETQQLKKGLMQKLLTGEWRVPVEETEAA